ncbi:MAG: DUF1611 domain-containing protein [Betaproteobacteria bacterium]
MLGREKAPIDYCLPCGARYAPDQFEGIAEVNEEGADMLAGGGCIGRVRYRNERIRPATRVLPLGCIAGRDGKNLNIDSYSIDIEVAPSAVPLIAVVGTAMNSGKTLATAKLSYGLRMAGLRVGVIKATGTGSFGDYHQYQDSGAHFVADFTDVGMATTYLMPLDRIKNGVLRLLKSGEDAGCDVVLMEIADGLLQKETKALLQDTDLRERLAGLIFACGDAVAAQGGVELLRAAGHEVTALTGLLSCSPMLSQEATDATGVPVLTKTVLAEPSEALSVLRSATSSRITGAIGTV